MIITYFQMNFPNYLKAPTRSFHPPFNLSRYTNRSWDRLYVYGNLETKDTAELGILHELSKHQVSYLGRSVVHDQVPDECHTQPIEKSMPVPGAIDVKYFLIV